MSENTFDDGKDGSALRTIGEIGRALGLKAHVLRYWEQQFPSLQPLKRSGGRRYYRAQDVALLRRIDQMVNREGYTIRGARAAIEGGGPKAASIAEQRAGEASVSTPGSTDQYPQLDVAPVGIDRAALLVRLRDIRAKLVEALGPESERLAG